MQGGQRRKVGLLRCIHTQRPGSALSRKHWKLSFYLESGRSERGFSLKTVKSELLLFPLALCPSSSWSLVGGVLARSLDPVYLHSKRKPLDEWTPYLFFPSQRRLVTISGSPTRLMVLLAQGSIMVEATHRMFSMLFTSA